MAARNSARGPAKTLVSDPHLLRLRRHQKYDVAIVGLGPVGSTCAALLAQAGLLVHVSDRRLHVPERPRIVTLDEDVLRVLQQINVLGALLPHLQPSAALEWYGVDGQLKRTSKPLSSFTLLQSQLERVLRQHLAQHPNVTVSLSRELTALDNGEHHVQVEWGRQDKLCVPWLVACDGSESTVRSLLGIELDPIGLDEQWMVVEATLKDRALSKLPRRNALFCEPARPCHYVVGPDNHRRWEFALQPGENSFGAGTSKRAWQLLSRFIVPGDAELRHVETQRFRCALAERFRAGRVFLAGDAAQVQPPFLEQDLSQGIRDVANLAWKLAAVQREDVAGTTMENLLTSYNHERRDHSQALLRRSNGLYATFTERNFGKAIERDDRLRTEKCLLFRPHTQSEWVPRVQAGLLGGETTTARGKVFPQTSIVLCGGDVVPMDHHFGCGWRLVMDSQLHISGRINGLVMVPIGALGFAETDATLESWMREHDCHVALLRPDHHVYGTANTFSSLLALLAEWRSSIRRS